MRQEIYQMLTALDGVEQDPRWHPEGDALYHSLQAFEHARRLSTAPLLWAAALLHDVGKAIDGPSHDSAGGDLLEGLVTPKLVWLVRHHLCLLRAPYKTRRRLRRSPAALQQLELLRRCDVAGRSPSVRVCSVSEALDTVFDSPGAPFSAETDVEAEHLLPELPGEFEADLHEPRKAVY